MKKSWFLFLTILLSGCAFPPYEDVFEMHVSYKESLSEITTDTLFTSIGNESLMFDVGSSVYVKIDVLYIPDDRRVLEPIILTFEYPDDDVLFFNPIFRDNLVSYTDSSSFLYELPIQPNQLQSFHFLIETSGPIEFQPLFRSERKVTYVDRPSLANEGSSLNTEPNVLQQSNTIELPMFHFQTSVDL
jgi:hypothetical protein